MQRVICSSTVNDEELMSILPRNTANIKYLNVYSKEPNCMQICQAI